MAKKKQTGRDLLDQYKQETGYGISRQSSSGSTNGQALLDDYLRNGGGQNVKNGPYNPDYRTNTKKATPQSYEAAYQQYKQYVAEYQKQTEFPRRVSVGTAAQQAGGSQKRDYSRMLGLNQLDGDMQPRVQAAQDIQKYLQFQRKVQTGTAAQKAATNAGQDYSRLIGLNQFDGELERRAAEQEKRYRETVLPDQLRGMKRTSAEMQKQLDQLYEQKSDEHFRDYQFDENGTAWYTDENGTRRQARGVMDIQSEIDALETRKAALDSTRALGQAENTIGALDEETRELLREYNKTGYLADNEGAEWKLRQKGYSYDQIKRLAEYEQYLEDFEDYQKRSQSARKFGQDAPVTSTVASSLLAPFKALGNIESLRGILPKGLGGYQNADMPTNIYSPLYFATHESSGIRSGVMEGMGPVGQFLYQAGTSALDSAVNMAVSTALVGTTGLSGEAASSAVAETMNWVMGSQVAADSVYAGIQSGKSNQEALIDGIVEGAIEGFTEKYSVGDAIKNMLSGKQVWKKAMRAFVSEGAEEIASNWLNRIYDVVAKHDRGEVMGAYAEYLSKGNTKEKALALTLVDMLAEDGLSFLAGGISGLAMSGAYAGTNKAVEARSRGKQLNVIGQVMDAVESMAKERGDQATAEAAQAVMEKVNAGQMPETAEVQAVVNSAVKADQAAQAETAFQTYNQYADERDARQAAREAPQQASVQTVQAVQEAARPQQTPAQTAQAVQEVQNVQTQTGKRTQADAGRRAETREIDFNKEPQLTKYEQAQAKKDRVFSLEPERRDEIFGSWSNANEQFAKRTKQIERDYTDRYGLNSGTAVDIAYMMNWLNSRFINSYLSTLTVENEEEARILTQETREIFTAAQAKASTELNGYTRDATLEAIQAALELIPGGTETQQMQKPSRAEQPQITQEAEAPKPAPAQAAREAQQQGTMQAAQEAAMPQQKAAQTVIQEDTGRGTEQYGQQETSRRNGEGRTESVYSGGQSRRMGAGSEIERTLERQGETVRLRNRARNIGAENISPAEAGLKGGDTTKSLLKIPVEAYGEHEKALQKAVEARGASLNIVMGRIRLANGTAVDEFIDTGTRQITVRADCTKWAMENLIDHALFHDLSTEQRNAAAQAVADRFSESELMAIAGQYVKRMRGVYEGMSEEALFNIATEEVLADAAGRMLRYTDADATKFTETVRGILNENTAKPRTEQEVSAKAQQPTLEAAQAAQKAARQESEQAAQTIQETAPKAAWNAGNGFVDGADGQRYSMAGTENGRREQTQDEITAEYQNTVHGILNGTVNVKGALLAGYTPEVYRKLGMPDLPFVVGSGHVYSMAKTATEASADGKLQKGTNYHGLGESFVSDIMDFVRDPVMVIAAKDINAKATPMRSTHSVVALIDVGTRGNALVIPVSITAERSVDGVRMDVNAISSAYEKNVSALVNEAVAQFNTGDNSVFYVKKEAADLLGAGVQFPEQLKAAASSDGIVRKFDSKINMSIENVTQSQQFKRWFGDWQNKPETASKVVNADGTPKVVYHQTGNDFTIFDVRKNGAGTRDNETPFGIFLKSSSRDIGLNGKKQMALYANIRNPIYAQDRADLTRQLRELSPEYDAIRQEHAVLDKEYKQKFEDAKRNFINFLTEWKKNHPGESSRSLYGTPEFERVFDAEDDIVEEWTSKADAISVRAKEVLTDALKQAGYDGVILANDAGSWGRSTDAYIALSENQVKSATDNVGTFDRDNPDIRYSPADTETNAGTDTETADAAKKAAEGVPIFNFDAKADWAYSSDPNPFYRLMGITPPGVRVGIVTQGARAADWAGNGKAYTKALLDFVTKPDRSTKTLTLQFPNADGTYRAETVQNTKFMQDVYKYYAETVPEGQRLDEATFWMMRRKLAEGSIPARIQAMSAEAKGQAWQESSRNDFKSTGALEKMGVKVERSVGRYGKTQTLIEMDKAFKQAKKEVNRAIDRLGATAKEVAFARQIADGVFDMQDIPQGFSKRVVLSLVDYMNAEAALGEDRLAAQRKSIRQDTTAVLETLFKDVKDNKVQDMFTLNHRTAQRNMLRIFGDETGEKINKAIFDPIKGNESERIRFINRQFDDVREFADSTGRKSELTHEESILVQLVMEGKATEALLGDMPGNPQITKAGLKIADGMKASEAAKSEHLNKNEKQLAKMYASWVGALRMMADGKIDAVKIDNAAKAYTQKYNEFYAAINDFLVAHGYEPIGFIQNYAPHMQSEESRGALDSALKALGLNEDTVTLPTSIAGLTANFKPNKRWNPYFLHRTSETYNFDAAKGFESYVAYMSEVFYHTDDIMTVRALSDYLRRRYSSEEISFDIDRYTWLREKLPDEQLLYLQQEGKLPHGTIADQAELDTMIEAELDKLYEDAKNKSTYSNLVVWLDNYANILAGKQTMGDRSTEADFGRKMLNLGNRLTRGFGAAKVAGNIATILNQTAQLPVIVAEKGVRNTAAAVKDMVTGQLRKADFAMESDYLTSKKGVHFLVTDEKNMYEWALDKVGQAQEFADAMVSTIAVRAAYLEGIQKGMTHEQAMRYADKYGAAVMGDRSKGAKPVAFNSKSPVMQLVNTFQLEVANSWEHLTQDTAGFDFRMMAKKYGKDKAIKALAGVIVKYLIAAFIMNRLSDEIYGGTPAQFDVLGITSNFVASGYGLSVNDALRTVMDDGWEKLTGERLFGTENEERSFDGWKALEGAGGDIANDIPYLQNASALIGWGDNSLPAAIPTKALDKWINAVKGGKSAQDVAKATFDVGTEVIPGGSQIKKTARGIDAMLRGGVYQGYGDQTKLRYPVDNKNIGKWIQAVVFGPNGLSETGRYYAGEERAIGEKQTTAYQAMIAAGADKEESYRLIRRISKLGDGEDSKLDKLNMLLSSKVSTAGRGAYYYLMMAGDKERERIDTLTGENGVLGMDEYLKASQKKLQIDADESMKASAKAAAFRQWANQQGYSAAQKRGILDAFKFAQIIMEGGGHTELYQAATEGVSEYETLRADAIAAEMAGGKTKAEAESSVNSSLRSQMKQDFQDGLADEETAAAFLKEYCGAEDEHDVYWTLEEWKGGEGWKKYGQFLDAVDKGVLADTRKVAKEYMKHGVDKGDLSSQLTKHFKEAWLAATGDEATRLKNAYISAYKAIGGDADKARDNIIKWRREANKKKGDKK